MPVRIGAGLSILPDPRGGAEEAAAEAARALDGRGCDLAVVFVSGRHLAVPEAVLEAIGDVLSPAALIGCGAQGVLGGGTEVEHGTAVSVWAADLGSGSAEPFQAVVSETQGTTMAGLPDLEGASGAILLVDPATFPAEPILHVLSEWLPDVPVLGGISSARLQDGSAALFLDDQLLDGGAVGVRFDGVDVAACVSQGASPIGPELTVTAAEGNVILELAGRPAYERLREVVEHLPPLDAMKLERSGGVLLGLVVDPNKPDYLQGDFLVRPLIGADRLTGALALGRPGQVVRLHVRDAESADTDLRQALDTRTRTLSGPPAGALVFACNGRGRAMFGAPDHDAEAVDHALAGAPSAGFFAAGEIGPVAGECHLHGFTATVALFA
jgi:small ligand-binding sensory domain FIST